MMFYSQGLTASMTFWTGHVQRVRKYSTCTRGSDLYALKLLHVARNANLCTCTEFIAFHGKAHHYATK